MRSPSALLPHENFFFLLRFIFRIRLLRLCERYILSFNLSRRTAPSVVHETAQPAEEGREEGVFQSFVRAER